MPELYPYQLEVNRTSRRKTIGISVAHQRVTVLAPRKLAQKYIDDLLKNKADWIQKKLRQFATATPYQPKTFQTGERFLWLGDSYPLVFCPSLRTEVKLQQQQLAVCFSKRMADLETRPEKVQRLLQKWYWQNAEIWLKNRTQYYAKMMGLSPRSVTIKNYKSRWGTCSTQGNIDYNWRLIFAPEIVIDYVAVHELAHLKHHNHSPAFWQLVESIIPNYKQHRKWLRLHGPGLRLD